MPKRPVGEERGQLTGTRIVPTEGGALKFENSFRTNARILDVDCANTGTTYGYPRRDGSFYTDGSGVLMTVEGEAVPWWVHGIGRPAATPPAGNAKLVGYLQTPSRRFERLARAPFIAEASFDEKGIATAKLFEWETEGSPLAQGKDRPTGMRVLDLTPLGPRVEFSLSGSCTMWGNEVGYMATYISTPRVNGTLFGVGHGVFMSPDGEIVPWRAAGIGTPTGRGFATNYHGSICVDATEGKLEKLSAAPLLIEEEMDESGNGVFKAYEYR